jgi:DNA-binding response OmpR family regulator
MELVLVVDDNEGYSRFMETLLARMGYRSHVTRQGDAALHYMKQSRPHLIVLDYCLPKGPSADKILRLLKMQEASKGIPVVVISGENYSADDEVAALDAGADLFLAKDEISDMIGNGSFQRHIHALIMGHQASVPSERQAVSDSPIINPGRVLVVEDDPEMLGLLAFLLSTKGYTVLTADTALEGLTKARQGSPDLLVLDIILTDMSGLEVSAQLKGNPATRHIPIMVLTGQSSDKAAQEAVRRGADHFMTKPIKSAEQFLGMIAALIGRKTQAAGSPCILRFGDVLVIDEEKRTLSVGGRAINDLPQTLFRLANEFARNPGITLDRDHLINRVWEGRKVRDRVVDQYIKRCVIFSASPSAIGSSRSPVEATA